MLGCLELEAHLGPCQTSTMECFEKSQTAIIIRPFYTPRTKLGKLFSAPFYTSRIIVRLIPRAPLKTTSEILG